MAASEEVFVQALADAAGGDGVIAVPDADAAASPDTVGAEVDSAVDAGPDVQVTDVPVEVDAPAEIDAAPPCNPAKCDDNNPCTDDKCGEDGGCIALPNAATCDDGDKCSEGDKCAGGKCGGVPVVCPADATCTTHACQADKGCVELPKIASCSDGDACTTGDACNDNNPCTDESCDKVKGCVYLANAATCSDGDACTFAAQCSLGQCQPAVKKSCDDGNPCTQNDKCDAKTGCEIVPLSGVGCSDNNECTIGDKCDKGTCKAGDTVPPKDDNNPCTDDTCDPKLGFVYTANKAACDDSNACTEGDVCAQAVCLPGKPKLCDDANPCTTDKCDDKAGCQFAPNTAKCSDNSQCTSDDTCNGAGKCAGKAVVCDDGEACTDDACDAAKGCGYVANSKPCEDGNACTDGDACSGGACKPGKAKKCDDGNLCTDDTCSPTKGCQVSNNTALCDDANLCTLGDVCGGGKCNAGTPKVCDDGNACTDDACDPKSGCTTANNTAKCSDGDVCTLGDACKDGKCVGSTTSALETFDGKNVFGNNALGKPWINDGQFNDGSGYKWSVGGGVASNSWAGNANAQPLLHSVIGHRGKFNLLIKFKLTASGCSGSAGIFIVAVNANANGKGGLPAFLGCAGASTLAQVGLGDGVAVKADVGLKADTWHQMRLRYDGTKLRLKVWADGSAEPANDQVTVDAADTAATNDQISLGGDLGGGQTGAVTVDSITDDGGLYCDDGNPCTTDTCDKIKGCTASGVADGTACDDGNGCTTGDKCTASKCKGAGKDCDDNNACTDDGCTSNICAYANNSAGCSDGDACTQGDKCGGGKCGAGAPIQCDDNNPCTDDSCNKASGCVTANNTKACNDNDACTANDACAAGVCKGGSATVCDDKNACTTDSCDKASGCKAVNVTDGSACDDGSKCTSPDACTAGKCGGTPVVCDDKNPCTTDSCDLVTGCKVANDDTAKCTDGDACTTGDKCGAGKCAATGTLNCDDGNACTNESCDKTAGCSSVANTVDCSDGNACTVGDKCKDKSCVAGAAKSCDDGNLCTIDKCDPADGSCKTTPAPQSGSEGKEPDGIDNDCDGLIDEEFDQDHDGVFCKGVVCQANEADNCPTVWTPGNAKEPCAALGSGWLKSTAVVLTEPGLAQAISGMRRTNEVVEVPLVNGYVDASIVAYYPLDGDGTDASPVKNDLAVGGQPTWVKGAVGSDKSAFQPGGGCTNAKAVNALLDFDGKTDFTIMAWLKIATLTTQSTESKIALMYRDANDSGFGLIMLDEKYPSLAGKPGLWGNGACGVDVNYASQRIDDNNWHHAAIVRKSGVGSYYYVDGALTNVSTANKDCSYKPASAEKLFVGSGSNCANHWPGAIDDVVVLRRPLAPAEVAAYAASKAPYGTALVPGAQPDFDDVRITEVTPYQGEHLVPSEVVGVRQFSDSDLSSVAGWWKLDGEPDDSGPTKLPSKFVDAVAAVPGRFGGAGSKFDDGYLDTGLPFKLTPGQSFSIEGWVKSAPGNDNHYFCSWAATGNDFYFQFDAKQIQINMSGVSTLSPAFIVDGAWHHVGMAYDDAAGQARAYVDGVRVLTAAVKAKDAAPPSPSCLVGALWYTNNAEVAAKVKAQYADVVVHKVAKSDDYFYKRVHPGVPTIRFLAHTKPFPETGKYAFLNYKLWSSNAAATAPALAVKSLDGQKTCNALLDQCLGYEGWWRFDEVQGGWTADSSARARHASFTGAATALVGPGSSGAALVLDGAVSAVASGFDPQPGVNTIEASAFLTELGNVRALAARDHHALYQQDGLLYFANGTGPQPKAPVKANTWFRGAGTWDGSKSRIFVDGAEVAAKDNTTAALTGGTFGFGWELQSQYPKAKGLIDDVRIMNRALTPDELLHHPPATWKLTAP